MNKLFKILLIGVISILVIYLLIPSPAFPEALPNSPQSKEPGDLRDPHTFAAYFTDMPRKEVIAHYQNQFKLPGIFSFISSYRLNYPPENAFTLIADQTLSTYLEERVFPFRESLFINGYEPADDKDKIAFEGQPYFSKVTIRYYRSNTFARLFVITLSLGAIWWIGKEYKIAWKNFWKKK